jgi:hypothetical protein
VIPSDILPTSGLTATSDRRRRQTELPVIATQIPGCFDPVRNGESDLLVSGCEAHVALGRSSGVFGRPDAETAAGANGRRQARREFVPWVMHATLSQQARACSARAAATKSWNTLAPGPRKQLVTPNPSIGDSTSRTSSR